MRSKSQDPRAERAVIIIGHGSKQRGFQAAMERVAAALRRGRRFGVVLCAYLEITKPLIPEAIGRCVQKGAKEIIVLPYFLLTGRHVEQDIPRIAAEARKKYKGKARIKLAPYLGYHGKIVEVVKQRIGEA